MKGRLLTQSPPRRTGISLATRAAAVGAVALAVAAGLTLAAASSLEGENKQKGSDKDAAARVGALVAQRALDKGVKEVVFDRGSYLYHGRVKALADAAREAGLDF